jgi:hypothetical protein
MGPTYIKFTLSTLFAGSKVKMLIEVEPRAQVAQSIAFSRQNLVP